MLFVRLYSSKLSFVGSEVSTLLVEGMGKLICVAITDSGRSMESIKILI